MSQGIENWPTRGGNLDKTDMRGLVRRFSGATFAAVAANIANQCALRNPPGNDLVVVVTKVDFIGHTNGNVSSGAFQLVAARGRVAATIGDERRGVSHYGDDSSDFPIRSTAILHDDNNAHVTQAASRIAFLAQDTLPYSRIPCPHASTNAGLEPLTLIHLCPNPIALLPRDHAIVVASTNTTQGERVYNLSWVELPYDLYSQDPQGWLEKARLY